MRNINHLARQQRHQKIGLNGNKVILKKRKSYFLSKILLTALLVSLLDFSSSHFYYAVEGESFFVPKKSDLSAKVFILEEDGFVLKREVQTEKRDKQKQHDIIKYTVQKGDTLSSIAYEYQIKISTILDANSGLSPWETLIEGKNLKILPIDGIAITLDKDNNIRDIANEYRVKQEIIREQNAIGSGITALKKGDTLIIPGIRSKQIITQRRKAAYDGSNYFYDGKVSGNMIMPCNGVITQYFHKGHYGMDIANKNKGPIFAAANGIVSFVGSGWNGGYGNMIVIDHGKGMKTLYAHNEKMYVEMGETIKQGQTIAWMGKTGRVRGKTGIHLHFEVIINGKKRDPYAYF